MTDTYQELNIDGKDFVLVPKEEYMGNRVGRKEIMDYLEVSNAYMTRHPWVYPDFGAAVQGKRGTKPYLWSDVKDWLALPENRRKKIYKDTRRKNEDQE